MIAADDPTDGHAPVAVPAAVPATLTVAVPPAARLRAVVADDEPPARRRVCALLAQAGGVEVAAECGSGDETVAAVERLRPDLLFLDVQMPDGGGFDVLAALAARGQRARAGAPVPTPPVVVFVTAYDEYALRAFDVHAVDYLLKPFDRERFLRALDRARVRVLERASAAAPALDPALAALLAAVRTGLAGAGPAAPRAPYLERVAVRVGERVRLVSIDDVDYVTAEANYVRLHAGARSYLVRETMQHIAARLDPARFLRVHRSTIVRVDRVVEVEPLFQGEYVLVLRGGAKVTSARAYRDRVRAALGLD